MYYRRKILLKLIAAFRDQGIKKITLQKLLFLLCKQQQVPTFDFVPYKYSRISFQASKDLHVLANHYQLLREVGDQWLISHSFDIELKPAEIKIIDTLLKEFKSIDSKWDMQSRQEKNTQKDASKAEKQTCLFTIGYESKSIDAYLNQLIENDIPLLCDVRRNPLSMKYGFSKTHLKKYCGRLKILYEHIPELGIASQKRQDLKNKQDYQNLFKNYKQELPKKKDVLKQVWKLLQAHKRIALTCFEKGHQDCHRHCISDYLQKNYQLECLHL